MISRYTSVYEPQGWRVDDLYHPSDICDLVLEVGKTGKSGPMWSPNIFGPGIIGSSSKKAGEKSKGDYAVKNLWIQSGLLVLDVDEKGMRMEKAINLLSKFTHVIGSSFNHKEDADYDKYRIIVWPEEVCTTLADYEYTLYQWGTVFGADRSKFNGGARFYGCKDIYSVNERGQLIKWVKAPKRKKQLITHEGTGAAGVRELHILERGWQKIVGEHGRPGVLFKVACQFCRDGVELSTAIKIINSSNLVKDMLKDEKRKYSLEDNERQIKSAYRNQRNERDRWISERKGEGQGRR
jgi:hypothetical protein